MSVIQPRLQYNYAKINLNTGLCAHCRTYSYEIPLADYILVPVHTNDYVGKYYNVSDQQWYLDASFSTIWAEAPQW